MSFDDCTHFYVYLSVVAKGSAAAAAAAGEFIVAFSRCSYKKYAAARLLFFLSAAAVAEPWFYIGKRSFLFENMDKIIG